MVCSQDPCAIGVTEIGTLQQHGHGGRDKKPPEPVSDICGRKAARAASTIAWALGKIGFGFGDIGPGAAAVRRQPGPGPAAD